MRPVTYPLWYAVAFAACGCAGEAREATSPDAGVPGTCGSGACAAPGDGDAGGDVTSDLDAGVEPGASSDGGDDIDSGPPLPPDTAVDCDPLRTFEGSLNADRNGDLEVLRGVTVINGIVTVEGRVNSLSALSCVTTITAHYEGVGTHVDDEEEFGLDLNGTSLSSLSGLERLANVSGGLAIRNNRKLVDLQGLGHLSDAYVLVIENNLELKSLDGLEALTAVGETGPYPSASRLSVGGNAALESLRGLRNLARVSGRLEIRQDVALASLEGLNNVTNVGELLLAGNTTLIDLTALGSLTAARSVRVTSNAALTGLSGLGGLAMAADVIVTSNPALTSLIGLDNLTEVSGSSAGLGLSIEANSLLSSLAGLDDLTHVGRMSVENNDAMTNLSGANSLTTVGVLEIHTMMR
jgi:hypothetical protein